MYLLPMLNGVLSLGCYLGGGKEIETHYKAVRFQLLIFYGVAAGTFNGNQLITAGEGIFFTA